MFNMPIKRKSFNAIHWGSDAGSQMTLWSWPQPILSNIPDFEKLQMLWSQKGTSHSGVLVSRVSDAQILSARIVSPTREFVTLPWLNFTARPYRILLKPSTTPSFPWMTLRKENTVAAEDWGGPEAGWVLQRFEQSQCSNKATSWEPPVNLNTKFLIQFIRMQMQCEQLHQGKDRISLIRHAAAYVSFNMQCKIDTEWQTDDF